MRVYQGVFFAVWFFIAVPIPSWCKIVSLSGKKISLLNTIETKNCFVSFVMINGHRYLIKQKKDYAKQIAVVRDALAAFLAKGLKIAHDVDIISFKKSFPGKINELWPATLHTIALGDTVRKQRNCIYSTLRLRQLWALAKNFEETGITRNIITQMAWHRQLPIIVGLDIVIGNSDRHCGNLCYDPKTDSFCAIDMDDTFNKDLCLIACKKLERMIKDPHIVFTVQEITALDQLRKTIIYLINHHKAPDVVKKMYHFARKAGFTVGSKMYNPSIERKLLLYESMIIKSWKNAFRLIKILGEIVDKHVKGFWYVAAYNADNAVD